MHVFISHQTHSEYYEQKKEKKRRKYKRKQIDVLNGQSVGSVHNSREMSTAYVRTQLRDNKRGLTFDKRVHLSQ